jgi:hypothetical protein
MLEDNLVCQEEKKWSEVRGGAVSMGEAETLRQPGAVSPATISQQVASAVKVTVELGSPRGDLGFEAFKVTGKRVRFAMVHETRFGATASF